MPKAKASTKKFQKHHLGRELKQRKHDQKKKAIREKSLAKYAPKEGEEREEGDEEDEEQEEGGALAVDEAAVFSTKAKSKPLSASAAPGRRAPAAAPAATTGKPAAKKKAPSIEDVNADVDAFLDARFLDDDSAPPVDERALDDDEGEDEEDEEEDERMGEDANEDDADEEEKNDAELLAEIEAHERELANLASTDPEFYSHLQKHDKELLAFSGAKLAEDDAQDEDEDEEGGAGAEDVPEQGEDRPEQEVLDMAGLKALEKAVLGPSWSVRALKKLLRAFRSAVHIGEVTGKQGGKKKGESDAVEEARARKEAAFRHTVQIHSSQVYNELIRFVLNNAARIFAGHHLAPVASSAAAASKKGSKAGSGSGEGVSLAGAEKHPKWSTLGPLLKALLAHVLFFLSTLRANPRMARFVLGAMERLVPLMHPFPKLAAKFLRELLVFWSEGEQLVRVDAFLRVRQMAIELSVSAKASSSASGGESMLELCLKGIYLTYVRHAKFASALTLPVVEFMANCVVELYGLDPVLSYQHAFVYIRQLAIHLRTALLAKKKDAHRAVYNWSFVNSIRVWTKVLAAHGKPSHASEGANGVAAAADNLHALVYPLVQVSLGTLGLLPSSRYFPLRFHLVRMLLDLCDACTIYVPLAPYLLSVLSAPELSRKPVASTRKALDIHSALKAPKHILSTKTYQESVVGESLHLLLRYFSLYSTSIAYPELVLPALKRLRREAKENLVIHRVRKQVAQTILKLEANVQWIQAKRNGAPWAPKDMGEGKKGVDGLRTFSSASALEGKPVQQSPLQRFVELAVQERRLLDEAKADWDGSKGTLAAEAKRAAAKKKNKGGDSDDEEDDDEGEDEEAAAHQRRRARDEEGEDEDDDEDMEDGEDEDEDEDEDDEDARPAKKARRQEPRAPHKAFEYPAGLDEEDGADGGDQLEVFNFDDSDEEDSKPRAKKGKQQQQKSAAAPAKKGKQQQGGVKQEKKQAGSVKKENGAGSAGTKRKR
jgi:nucleolar complex protein 2